MATKNYTTKTASLRATKADVRTLDTKKLFIDGVNITDLIKNGQVNILDDRGILADDELDIWRSNVSTDVNGNVIVREYPQKFEISITDMTSTQKSTLKAAVKVENNQVLGTDDTHLMFFETNALTDGDGLFQDCKSLTSFNSDLNNLVTASSMFYYSSLESFNGDLSSLSDGSSMFFNSSLKSFGTDSSGSPVKLRSLTNGPSMFASTKLASFNGDLNNLVIGSGMFYYTPIESFNGDLSSLVNGSNMFDRCSKLTSFSSDLSSLVNGSAMFPNSKLDAPSLANIIHTINTPTEKGTINIGLGIDNTNEARQALAEEIWCKDWNEVNQDFDNKNWTVQWVYNGAPTSSATLDMDTTPSPIWAKIEEVVADENGKLPHYSYVSEDGSKYFNLYWYHSSNGNNEGYDYFGSLLEACGYFGIVPKQYAEQN